MPLKIVLKPGEQVYIGTTKVTVSSGENTTLIIDGNLPVLRNADYFVPTDMTQPRQQFVHLLQEAYLTGQFSGRADRYQDLIGALRVRHPELADVLSLIEGFVAESQFYKALRASWHLVDDRDRE